MDKLDKVVETGNAGMQNANPYSETKPLQSHNVRIHRKRTSVRLEPQMWAALNDIANREKCSIHDLCGAVHDFKYQHQSFTAALRVFLMEYYRSSGQESPYISDIQQRLHGSTNL